MTGNNDDYTPYILNYGGVDDNFLYISHLHDIEGLSTNTTDFRYWILPTYPDSVTDSMSSTFTPTTALGRTAPVYTYSSSGPRTVQISLKLHRDMMDMVNTNNESISLDYVSGEDYIDNMIKALQSIALPKYNLNNQYVEPPLVAIKLGSEIFIRGVVSNGIGVTYTKPILTNNKYAQVEVTLNINEVTPYDAVSVFKEGSFRGMTNSMKDFNALADATNKIRGLR